MMGKRVVSLPFTLFASGYAFAVLAIFVAVCDLQGFSIGLFRHVRAERPRGLRHPSCRREGGP